MKEKNKNKKIERFISITCIVIILSFGTIIYNKLAQKRPSGLASRTIDSIQNDDLNGYKLYLEKQLNKIKDKKLKIAVYNRLGKINLSLKKYPQALETYKNAYEIDPKNAGTCANLGLVLIQMHRYDEAIKYLNKAKSIDPKIPQIYNNLGVIFINKEKIPEAINNFKKAIKIDPKFYRAYTNLASAYVRLKNYQKAKDYIHQALKEGANKSPEFKQLLHDQLKTLKKLL
ncbi:MAG: tetratricopeptide repeat protein [Candidatus Omnitrophica bacterium]|nr:tetratricopeptide repeat protein [Candidatus Omnitrophota bacterium]